MGMPVPSSTVTLWALVLVLFPRAVDSLFRYCRMDFNNSVLCSLVLITNYGMMHFTDENNM